MEVKERMAGSQDSAEQCKRPGSSREERSDGESRTASMRRSMVMQRLRAVIPCIRSKVSVNT